MPGTKVEAAAKGTESIAERMTGSAGGSGGAAGGAGGDGGAGGGDGGDGRAGGCGGGVGNEKIEVMESRSAEMTEEAGSRGGKTTGPANELGMEKPNEPAIDIGGISPRAGNW